MTVSVAEEISLWVRWPAATDAILRYPAHLRRFVSLGDFLLLEPHVKFILRTVLRSNASVQHLRQ